MGGAERRSGRGVGRVGDGTDVVVVSVFVEGWNERGMVRLCFMLVLVSVFVVMLVCAVVGVSTVCTWICKEVEECAGSGLAVT